MQRKKDEGNEGGVGGKGNGRAWLEEEGEGRGRKGKEGEVEGRGGRGAKDRRGESGQMDLLCCQEIQTRKGRRLWVGK